MGTVCWRKVKLLLAWCRLCLPRRQQAGWGGPVAAAAAGRLRREKGFGAPLAIPRQKKSGKKFMWDSNLIFLEVIY